jgi:hypothetical protein
MARRFPRHIYGGTLSLRGLPPRRPPAAAGTVQPIIQVCMVGPPPVARRRRRGQCSQLATWHGARLPPAALADYVMASL